MNEKYYALKEIPKLKLSSYNEFYSSLNEPIILKRFVKYDFLPKIITSFQDLDNLYLITNFFEGDILYNYKDENMSETQIKFIAACIIQSLSYLRKEKIINRDVRMKNVIMDNHKYLNLIDFSFAINYSDKNNKKTYITPSKFEGSPEIFNHSMYDYNSDYYRIGTIIYYLIFKKFPDLNKKQDNTNRFDFKNAKNYTSTCIDFLHKLLITDYKKRIGFNNINELKNHNWFGNFNWEKFEKKKN